MTFLVKSTFSGEAQAVNTHNIYFIPAFLYVYQESGRVENWTMNLLV